MPPASLPPNKHQGEDDMDADKAVILIGRYRVRCPLGYIHEDLTSGDNARAYAKELDEYHPDHGVHIPERRRLYTNIWDQIPDVECGV